MIPYEILQQETLIYSEIIIPMVAWGGGNFLWID
jgi:hypothetical protein